MKLYWRLELYPIKGDITNGIQDEEAKTGQGKMKHMK